MPQPEEGTTTEEQEYYDDIYFDSSGSEDERGEDEERIKKIGKKVRKMTNDELFYDPKMDEEDEKWMKRQRMTYLNGMLNPQYRDNCIRNWGEYSSILIRKIVALHLWGVF